MSDEENSVKDKFCKEFGESHRTKEIENVILSNDTATAYVKMEDGEYPEGFMDIIGSTEKPESIEVDIVHKNDENIIVSPVERGDITNNLMYGRRIVEPIKRILQNREYNIELIARKSDTRVENMLAFDVDSNEQIVVAPVIKISLD